MMWRSQTTRDDSGMDQKGLQMDASCRPGLCAVMRAEHRVVIASAKCQGVEIWRAFVLVALS